MTTPISRQKLEKRVVTAVCAPDPNMDESRRWVIQHAISYYRRETLLRIDALLSGERRDTHMLDICVGHQSEEAVNDWCMLIPFTEDIGMSPVQSVNYLYALPRYKNLVPQKKDEYPKERLAQTRALIQVAQFLRNQGVNTIGFIEDDDNAPVIEYIHDVDLSTFIADHENPQYVADIMIERGITDAQQIKSIMETLDESPSAFSQGVI